jgi:hypothetical protein
MATLVAQLVQDLRSTACANVSIVMLARALAMWLLSSDSAEDGVGARRRGIRRRHPRCCGRHRTGRVPTGQAGDPRRSGSGAAERTGNDGQGALGKDKEGQEIGRFVS